MELFEPAAVVLLVLFGLLQLVAAFSAARMPLRVLGLPLRSVGELQEGRARVQGELTALSAVPTTFDGIAVVAIETRLLGATNWAGVRSAAVWGEAAISDRSGQCGIDLDGVLLFGVTRRWSMEPGRLQALCPALWAQCSDVEKARRSLTLEQCFVPVGGGFVAGEVAPGVRSVGEGYRAAPATRLVIGSGLGLPVVVASHPKAAILRHLLGPAALHAAAGLIALGLAAVVFSVDIWIARLGGVTTAWP